MITNKLLIGTFLAAFCVPAFAEDNHGCTVLLCLANPAGPKAVKECEAPINKLYRDLAKGKPFPACRLARSNSESPSWAEIGDGMYPDCPPGFYQAGKGQRVTQYGHGTVHVGIGNGKKALADKIRPLPYKTCCGNYLGNEITEDGSDTGIAQFDKLEFVWPIKTIDVYIDSVRTKQIPVEGVPASERY